LVPLSAGEYQKDDSQSERNVEEHAELGERTGHDCVLAIVKDVPDGMCDQSQ
jgi:hypothetical protein